MKLISWLRAFRKSRSLYEPLIEVRISHENILHNLKTFRDYTELPVAPVLKSNAYGHGLIEIASILDTEDCPFLIVDSLFEARILRHSGIKTPLLVIGYTSAENISQASLKNVSFVITSIEQLQEISTGLTKPQSFHIKVDTGMNRQGLLSSDLEEASKIIAENKLIQVEGICSHLADADSEDEAYSDTQISKWKEVVVKSKSLFPKAEYFHLSATAGARFADESATLMRLGIGLYGIDPALQSSLNLKPALEMHSVIGSVKSIPEGERIGYNGTFTSAQEMRIATVPAGYFEGVDRRLSNNGYFKVGGTFCPIIGRVSMNITTIDVSEVPNVRLSDKVTLISSDPKDLNSIENIAKICNTIPYEILVHIPQHLRRVVS